MLEQFILFVLQVSVATIIFTFATTVVVSIILRAVEYFKNNNLNEIK